MADASILPTAAAPVAKVSTVTSAPGSTRIPVRQLSQDDFFKLLVTQLSNQDPMEPLKDSEFMAQMAQFSSLEQSKSMGSDISDMRSQQQVLQAMGYVGKVVVLNTSDKGTVTGLVDGFTIEDGTPKIIVGDNTFELSQIKAVGLPLQSSQTQN